VSSSSFPPVVKSSSIARARASALLRNILMEPTTISRRFMRLPLLQLCDPLWAHQSPRACELLFAFAAH